MDRHEEGRGGHGVSLMARSKTWHEWGAVTAAKEPFDAATMKIIADTAREQVAAQE